MVKRLGRAHDRGGYGEFEEPTEIAINRDRVFVLDARGIRIHVLDRDGNILGRFPLPHSSDPTENRDNGLGTDHDGNVYVSSFYGSVIRVFRHDGQPVSAFGQPGHSAGEFMCPGGLCIDSYNRPYVADSGNGRVQLFQLKTLERNLSSDRSSEAAAEPHSTAEDSMLRWNAEPRPGPPAFREDL